MRRNQAIRNRLAVLTARNSLDALSIAELAIMARQKGVKGVPERMKRETLLSKLKGL